MEFSYIVSEPEFRRAWRLERKVSSRTSLRNAAFWILIMLGLMLIYRTLQPDGRTRGLSDRKPVTSAALVIQPVSDMTQEPTNFERVGPFLVIAGIWILIVGGMVPMRLRHLYRKDPRMQGRFTVHVTVDSIVTDNTAGTLSKSSWNIYDYWCEGKGVIVLIFHSGAYSILSLAGLSELQRDELRGILKGALRKK